MNDTQHLLPSLAAAQVALRQSSTAFDEAVAGMRQALHVGLYGYPSGDIPARHTFTVRSLNREDPENVYALVACVDPQGDRT